MIKKTPENHVLYDCDYAREMRQILSGEEYNNMGLAIAVDLGVMEAHYHSGFDEIFYLLEGSLECKFYDPKEDRTWTEELSVGDTLVVSKGVHHKLLKASEKNRLMVISIPPWHPEDVNPSSEI